jgi:hypothetical protein
MSIIRARKPRTLKPIDRSIEISACTYKAFKLPGSPWGGYPTYRVSRSTADGEEIPNSMLCACDNEADALFVAQALTLASGVTALAKPAVLDTLEL